MGAVRFRSGIEVLPPRRGRLAPTRRQFLARARLRHVVNRLAWDRETNVNPAFDVRDIVAKEDRFALRFLYAVDFIPTGGKIDVEMMYFYRLRGDKVAEFGLLASVDFDFKAKGTEGTHTRP